MKKPRIEDMKDALEKLVEKRMKEVDDAFTFKWAEMRKEIEPFFESLEKFSDRELVILSASLLDDYLERIITASYISDEKVKSIFKDEHVLQALYTKINIAYFPGLIPKWLFNDLRLICEIRNKFAHGFITKLDLNNETIISKINKCELRPKTMDGIRAPRLKFIIIIISVTLVLKAIDAILIYNKPETLIDLADLNSWDYEKYALTKDEIVEIMKKSGGSENKSL